MNSNPPSPMSKLSSISAVLGRNLIVARCAGGWTQQEVADRALISRATVVQIEAGSADPKLSTLEQLAHALGVAPALLFIESEDLASLASLFADEAAEASRAKSARAERLNEILSTGRVRELMRAARLAAEMERDRGIDPQTAVAAAVGAVALPVSGAALTAIWARVREGSKDGSSERAASNQPSGMPASE